MEILYLVVSFVASVVGAICGLGGGVIIKPVLDMLGLAGAATISFLSGCTVLAMSAYSVARGLARREKQLNLRCGTPLALGGALGGVIGKQLFSLVAAAFPNNDGVGRIQSACLALMTIFVLVYMLKREKVKTHQVESLGLCLLIGLVLGLFSSFLGIGGGPINLVVLFYFFSMDIKTAAKNSLYIILFSQTASLFTTLATHSVPEFSPLALALMVAGGIGGGIVGQVLHKKLSNEATHKLFMLLTLVIFLISLVNTFR